MSERDVLLPADVQAVGDAIAAVPGTHNVHVAGSGAAGDRTALSDWDFELSVDDDSVLKIDLIVPDRASPVSISEWDVTAESLPPLDAHFWDWTL